MNFSDLLTQSFLSALAEGKEENPGVPVYARVGDEARLIADWALPEGAVREFEETAADHGLYRGGAVVFLKTAHGYAVVPDERYGVYKPLAAGIARADEGHDLSRTAVRELMEEAFVFSLDQGARYVPPGQGEANLLCPLGFTVQEAREVGVIEAVGHRFNDENMAYEAMFEWDISTLSADYSIVCGEEWFRGGHSGIAVLALPLGAREPTGLWSGQQGYIPLSGFRPHGAMEWRHREKESTNTDVC